MIYFLQSIKTQHLNYGEQIELLFSREEKSPCSWTRTRSSQRHPEGGKRRLYNSHQLSPTQQSLKIRVSCLTWTSEQHLHLRQSLLRQKPSPTGITAPTTTPLGSGVPASLRLGDIYPWTYTHGDIYPWLMGHLPIEMRHLPIGDIYP